MGIQRLAEAGVRNPGLLIVVKQERSRADWNFSFEVHMFALYNPVFLHFLRVIWWLKDALSGSLKKKRRPRSGLLGCWSICGK